MLIIFDTDGVLRNFSWQGIFEAYTEIIKFAGKNQNDFFTDIKSLQQWFNHDWRKNLSRIFMYYPLEKELLTQVGNIFHKHYDPYLYIFPWAKRILNELSDKKHKLSILSSSKASSVENSLADLKSKFSLIVGSEYISTLKPEPDGIYFILKILKETAENSIIIGDTEVDILAGQAAGVKTGVVKWGACSWNQLLPLNPDYAFERPKELLLL